MLRNFKKKNEGLLQLRYWGPELKQNSRKKTIYQRQIWLQRVLVEVNPPLCSNLLSVPSALDAFYHSHLSPSSYSKLLRRGSF